jgi:hypothetical protein
MLLWERVRRYLCGNFLIDDADEVTGVVFQDQQFAGLANVEDYDCPEFVRDSLIAHTRIVARDYIERNCPDVWWRSLFMEKPESPQLGEPTDEKHHS